MTRSKPLENGKSLANQVYLIAFASLGEYPLHTRDILKEKLGPVNLINCAIRDQQELQGERLELRRGEELHTRDEDGVERPLLRLDQNGLWAWMSLSAEELWFPLRNQTVVLALDHAGRVRLKFAMTK